MAKLKYEPGNYFAVPLKGGSYGLGLIARLNPEGVLLGYFFGPKREHVSELLEGQESAAIDAILVGRFGDLGLKQGKWPVIGRATDWNAANWPMPDFVRTEPITNRSFRIRYADTDPNLLVGEELISIGENAQGVPDGLMGEGYVESALIRLLTES